MDRSTRFLLASLTLSIATLLTQAAPASTAGIADRTQDQKDRFLSMVCAEFNMITRQGQIYCLQEMYGQSLEFSKAFFAAMDFTPANRERRIEGWRKRLGLDEPARLTEEQKTRAETDLVYLIGYGSTCQQLSDTIMNPEQLLGLGDKTVDTLVGLPEYCVEQAVSVAHAFDLPIDFDEARHLSEHIDKVRAYYQAHPTVPDWHPGDNVGLPNPV